ncbi:MAG: oligopeptide/dipeptide ABC transporter ATP-binding protein, partial [Pigmentiphaga sp.]
ESSPGEEVAKRPEGRPFSAPGRPKRESSPGEEVAKRPEGRHVAPPLLELEGLGKTFQAHRGLFSNRGAGRVFAVDDVSLALAGGETLALVGESGSGKSTVARLALRLLPATAGTIRFRGQDITHWSDSRLRPLRRSMQMVFQDPFASLNPRMNVRQILEEPLIVHRLGSTAERAERVTEVLRQVNLAPHHATRYPHEFSGGQRQRLGIARALVLRPDLVICDEPVSALDVSIQAQIINLLQDLQRQLGLAYLFIAHDLAVVKHMADRVAVMYLGRLMEVAPTAQLFAHPGHPYTRMLLQAIPRPDPGYHIARQDTASELPSPTAPPPGCRFHTRCPHATEICREQIPAWQELAPGHTVACHHARNLPPYGSSGPTATLPPVAEQRLRLYRQRQQERSTASAD